MGTGKKLSFANESSHVQCDKLPWPEISSRSGMQWVSLISETNIATRFTEEVNFSWRVISWFHCMLVFRSFKGGWLNAWNLILLCFRGRKGRCLSRSFSIQLKISAIVVYCVYVQEWTWQIWALACMEMRSAEEKYFKLSLLQAFFQRIERATGESKWV